MSSAAPVVAIGPIRRRLQDSVRAFSEVFANPDLRRLLLASSGYVAGEWAYSVALAVYAFRIGGATAVGLIGLIRMLPAAVTAPVGSMLADRYRRERVLTLVYLLRAAIVGASAVAFFAHAPAVILFTLAGLITVVSAVLRPAQWALLPLLARTPEQLASANVASSMIEGVSTLAGPALAGILLAATDVGQVMAVTAGVLLWAGLVTARISPQPVPPRLAGQERVRAQALAGFRAIVTDRNPRLLVALFGAQTFIRGALNVLVVVCALSLLKMGDAGVGFLNSAFGVGGLIGSFAALALVGRRRLALPFGVGLLLWGIPIALVAAVPTPAAALVLLALPGVGNAVLDVSGLTLLQRITPNVVLGRVFGVLEGLVMTSIGLGSIAGSAVISILGIRGALIAVGALLPALAVVFWGRLRGIDAEAEVPEQQLSLLRAIPLFSPLPVVTLEHLASSLIPVSVPAGSVVVHEGESGDRFYAIDDGEAEVSIEGVVGRELGPGDYFGEIALLRDVPRTATVTARTALSLFALERDEFISAVTGHPQSASAADAVIGTRLGSFRLRGAAV